MKGLVNLPYNLIACYFSVQNLPWREQCLMDHAENDVVIQTTKPFIAYISCVLCATETALNYDLFFHVFLLFYSQICDRIQESRNYIFLSFL